jgi:uncharacterized NAD-dependent epimerase/dehydratase family protein
MKDEDENSSDDARRDLFFQDAAVATSVTIANLFPIIASTAATCMGTSPDAPIVLVLGADGKCGKFCTEILAKQGLYAKAVTRS